MESTFGSNNGSISFIYLDNVGNVGALDALSHTPIYVLDNAVMNGNIQMASINSQSETTKESIINEDTPLDRRLSQNEPPSKNIVCKMLYPNELDLIVPKPKRRKRRKNPEQTLEPTVQATKTRYGRVTKPKIIDDDTETTETKIHSKTGRRVHLNATVSRTVFDVKKRRRKPLPPQFRCETCTRGFIGHTRMRNHLVANPEHVCASTLHKTGSVLWNNFVKQAGHGDGAGRFIVDELAVFMRVLRTVGPRLFLDRADGGLEIDDAVRGLLGLNGSGLSRFTVNRDVLKSLNDVTDLGDSTVPDNVKVESYGDGLELKNDENEDGDDKNRIDLNEFKHLLF